MNRRFFILSILTLCLIGCSKGGVDSENTTPVKEPVPFDIVSVWEDASGNKENIFSFAKDGTYKMILKNKHYYNSYFFSTGHYTNYRLNVRFEDNCVEQSSKSYSFSVKDGELVLLYDNSTFKRSGMIESNAFENKLSGLKINYGGHSLAEHYKTIGQCNYYLEFTNDYRAYRIIEKVYWNDRKKGYHQIYALPLYLS